MTFMIIMIIVTMVLAVGFGIVGFSLALEKPIVVSVINTPILVIFILLTTILGLNAKTQKALIQSHLENPANYTYSQLAEHNKFVTEKKVWQGTIFSFYNDIDLQTIDINSVSQKVLIESDEE